MSTKKMLAAARNDLGLFGRPNRITRSYSKRNGQVYLREPWCDMSVTEWAHTSGNAAAVLPQGDRAYTVWHAQDGQKLGRWHAGTAANIRKHALPGAIVFFDWGGTDQIGAIDHVGVVERNLGDGRVQTIEGNTGDACKRRVRGPSVIAGFWNPPYSKQEATVTKDEMFRAVWFTDALPVPYGSKTNQQWQPRSVLTDVGQRVRSVEKQLSEVTAVLQALREEIAELRRGAEEPADETSRP